MFDEVCLSRGIHYNSTTDVVDSGTLKNQEYADITLVFMVHGIRKKCKQPVVYTFCQGSTKHKTLAWQLKDVRINYLLNITDNDQCRYKLWNYFFLIDY